MMRDDDIPTELADLFAAERRRDDVPPPGAKDRVHHALAASIGVGFGGTGAGVAAGKGALVAKGGGAALAKVAAGGAAGGAAAGGVAVGGGAAATATGGVVAKGLAFALVAAMAGTAGTGIYLAKRDDDEKKPVIVETAPAQEPPAGFDPSILGRKPVEPPPVEKHVVRPVEKPAPPVHDVVVAKPVEPPPPLVETPAEKAARLQGERTVLDDAQAAVRRGEGGAALIALEAHREKYRDGALVEEREALTVLALHKLGRTDEALQKAAQFRARFPSSLMQGAIDAELSR